VTSRLPAVTPRQAVRGLRPCGRKLDRSVGRTGVCYRILTTFEIAPRQADQGRSRA
jgi:hypothetical protein